MKAAACHDSGARRIELPVVEGEARPYLVALAGNPNTGKSTVFNGLTGLRQRTGNWSGITVGLAQGRAVWGDRRYELVDLPGTYSLAPTSENEVLARDFIVFGGADAVVVVVDANALERNLALVLQIREITGRVVLCLNMMDELARNGLRIDRAALERELGIPVVATEARTGKGLAELREAIARVAGGEMPAARPPAYDAAAVQAIDQLSVDIAAALPGIEAPRWLAARLLEGDETAWQRALEQGNGAVPSDGRAGAHGEILAGAEALREARAAGAPDLAEAIYAEVGRIVAAVVERGAKPGFQLGERLDRIATSRWLGFPIMFAGLMALMWVTIVGANYPSALLFDVFFWFADRLHEFMAWAGAPWWLRGALIDGLYRGLAWVVSVMLPPMAIFFPLFTLLEDAGYLPRVAFNMDRLFARAGGSGQQSLTMCMGFGCNAAGVISCRIISSPRERMVAILTNNFVPCNGRFPTIILVASLFIATAFPPYLGAVVGAAAVVIAIGLGVVATLLVTGALTRTILQGQPSAFVLEMPPYRRPRVLPVIYRSVYERTLRVLYRAVIMAAPAGLIIWIMGNVTVGGSSLMEHFAGALDGAGWVLGLDGVILVAFILAIPANEIIVPTIMMAYSGASAMVDVEEFQGLQAFFEAQGWTMLTAVALLVFVVLHNPCTTTLLSIKTETGSWRWTALSFFIPLVFGLVVLAVFANLARLLGAS